MGLRREQRPISTLTCSASRPGSSRRWALELVGGRDFDETDLTQRARRVALVNRSFARYYFGDAPAVGRRFGFGGQGAARDVTIIGVVEDAKYSDLREAAPHLVYTALGPDNFPTRSFSFSETTLIRAHRWRSRRRWPRRCAGRSAAIDPGLTVIGIATLEQHVDRSLGQDRLVSALSALFGALALALTCTGIYGVLSYGVTRRVREIGVRLALGARPAQIRWMVARRGLMVLGAGPPRRPAGGARGGSLSRLLFHVSKADVLAFIGALLALS